MAKQTMMSHIILTSIGWLGVALCTLGYLLLSTNVIKAKSVTFQLMNVFGGLFLVAVAVESRDIPNAAANLLWMFIALYALTRHLKTQKSVKKD
ncbi:CBU_0592 family membrane protein [Pedobacter cryoconitis]|uniref:Lipid-A-disaccharide synthase-like uncharacterized protein n=1 Tax=Pedobacter cryoconitis TaxID=188932 RepID=A0A7X0IZS0_9SPHI|nr:hypothetical protein [Pedobacter cryoconitis]MBB6498388.1 lipid-A-disaccharide synthase-like uncharacterized protein [Pedobacter cryoconitis]